MSENIIRSEKFINLSVANPNDHEMIANIGKALSSPDRIKILYSLLSSPKHLSELSQELQIPISSVSRHIDALAEAKLVFVSYQPGLKGHTKFCSHQILGYTVLLENVEQKEFAEEEYVIEMPIGMFTHCLIRPPCGMNGKNSSIEQFDDPRTFFLPSRIKAECLWFDAGFVSYSFPAPPTAKKAFSQISFSFEICSEAIGYNTNWPSDITVSINNVEVCTFVSPGDFGGRRGRFTPKYWPVTSTQFGQLKTVTINEQGVFVDNALHNKNIKFADLKLYDGNAIKLTIGIKDDAVHKGGINLFGKHFGDFSQAIIMTLK